MAMKKKPYRLVSKQISTDTVRALETLLRDARKGELIGLAYVAIYHRKVYTVNTLGEAKRSPTFTNGAIVELVRHVSNRVRKR